MATFVLKIKKNGVFRNDMILFYNSQKIKAAKPDPSTLATGTAEERDC